MSKVKTDKTICRYCKLKAPDVAIALIKGLPQGECKTCKRNRQLRHRLQVNFHLGLYKAAPDLVAVNLKTLATLKPGLYALVRNGLNTQVGYIIVQIETILVNLYNRCDLFHYELFGIATLLGDSNVFIDSKTPYQANANRPAIDPSELADLRPADVQERLLWLDRDTQAKAIKLLRDEIRQAKQANAAIARAKAFKKP